MQTDRKSQMLSPSLKRAESIAGVSIAVIPVAFYFQILATYF